MATVTFLADIQSTLILTEGFCFSNLGMSLTGIGKARTEVFRVFSWSL